jgi:hypothetical protein
MSKVLKGAKAVLKIGGEVIGTCEDFKFDKTNEKLEVGGMGMMTMMVGSPRKNVIIENLEKIPGVLKAEIKDPAAGTVDITVRPVKPIDFIEIKLDLKDLKTAAGHRKWDSIMEELKKL